MSTAHWGNGRIRRAWTGPVLLPLALAIGMPAAPAQASFTPRVVGGTPAALTPGWMAQVWVHDATGTALCGGELVSSRWVLTAAHCVRQDPIGTPLAPAAVQLRIGIPTLSEPTPADPGVGVDQILIDPANTAGSTIGDVALLHLAAAAGATPLALADPAADAIGVAAQVLGWGDTAAGTVSASLQGVAQPIVDAGRCGGYGADFSAESMICAGGVPGQDSCAGDSGGPLVLAPLTPAALLLGTVDYGPAQCGNGTAAVYQRVTAGSAAAWLRSVLVRPTIAADTTTPLSTQAVTLAASGSWPDAVYTWDLNGDGVYGDASGAAVTTRTAVPRTVSVQAIGPAEQDSAVTRLTLTPVDPSLSVTAPPSVKEGQLITLTATSRGGSGTLTATASGGTIEPTRSVAVAAAATTTSESFRTVADHAWQRPHTVSFALSTSGLLQLAATRLSVQVVDDHAPRLTGVTARTTSAGASVRAHVPGRGRLRVTATLGGRTVAVRTVAARAAQTLATRLPLSAALRRRHPQIRLRWTTQDEAGVSAAASRRLP